MKKIRVIQVGVGGFGKSWMELVMGYENTELAAIVDMIPDNLAEAKRVTNLSEDVLFTDSLEAFAKVNADLVLIVTPPKTHNQIAKQAIEAGFHVMMEKPLTHTFEEAEDLLEFTESSDKKVMISQNYRWRPPVQTVKKIIEEGIIGRIGYIEFEFRKAMKFGGWRDQYKEILLEDMAIHHFDLMRYLLNKEPVEILAQSYKPDWSWFSGNPTAGVWISFQDDIKVNYFGSWVSRGKETTWNGDIRVVGDKGAIEMIDDQVHYYLENEEEGHKVNLTQMKYEDRLASLDEMVTSILENRQPSTSIKDNLKSFMLTCMAISSAQTGQKVIAKDFSPLSLIEHT